MTAALDWPLVVARFSLLTLGIGLFGQACFDLYAPASVRRGGSALARVLPPLAATAAALAWLIALAGATSGGAAPGALASFCLGAVPGRALVAAALLGLALAGLALAPQPPARLRAVLSGALLTSLAFVGHAATVGGGAGATRIAVMAIHLLGAGVWLGGLPSLALALRRAGPDTLVLLREFSRIALAAVALLATTGMIVAVAVLSLAGGAPGMTYVKMLGVKLGLVAVLLGLAAVNRWRLTPLAARDPAAARRGLIWTVAGEQLLAVAVIAAASLLAQIDPTA